MEILIATQLGATQVSKPPLGGWGRGVQFTDEQAAVLDAVADEIIPGGDGFPAPSSVNIVGFFARYVTPASEEAKWYPFLPEIEFKARLGKLAGKLMARDPLGRVEVLRRLEADDAEFFTRVRDVVYYGYYSRPEVIRAINIHLEAGKDYRYSPQPFGYSDSMADWDEALLSRVTGTYIRTQDVRPVDLPDDLAARRAVKRSGVPDLPTAQPAPTPSGA
ncbi:gluconate 2-dehydrogenase subunit 3 family protein [Cellulomonas fimi]|uniref:Gluconate 2-dehydrogenase subunit 3 family protein n=1 Tax=Cellulomonas fimi TaxID=1708 RepID=A0A7Y0M1B0_CELFI|nr:gluconate 2-dehydrogenase subunit 3 family protein [Cellulomonas fimi]NMR21695.1 gluconate 2-dehydrogenase subunit 3 family protein [Cellulomonas fimi]